MATRILIQLAENESIKSTAATLPPEVKELLESVGAGQIMASHPELPGLYTAIVPDEVQLEALLERLRKAPGVRHAEADVFRSSL